MNLDQAIQFGLLVKQAEDIAPANLTNAAGQSILLARAAGNPTYRVITTLYANDLATDSNPARGTDIVSIGLVLQAANNDLVIALRGTAGLWEWVEDAKFLTVKFPLFPAAGETEDGFTAIYNSLRVGLDPTSPRLTDALATLPFNQPLGSLAICGHSLGGALATLLALDIAANTPFKSPTVFTYASPRVGNPAFAGAYNQLVPQTFRIANRLDLVPKLPLPPLYEHVTGLYELLPARSVRLEFACQHHLTTYLFLLTQLANHVSPTNIISLDPGCAAAA